MTLKNNRAHFLGCFKLCASFVSHMWTQTGVTVRTCPNWGKICFENLFWYLWPWLLTLTFCMDIASVSVNYSWWEVCVTKRWTGSFRAAWLQLKISILLQVFRRPLGNLPLHEIVVHSHSLGRVAIPDWSQAKGDTHVSVKSSQVQIIACPLFGANTLRLR